MPNEELNRYEARLQALRVERSMRELAPRVVAVQGEATELQPPGSICITAAPAGSEVLQRLGEAAAGADAATIEEILNPIKRTLSERSPLRLRSLARVIEQTNAFVDVSYGGRQLVPTLFVVDDVPVSRAILPYVGGGLATENFTVTEYLRSDQDRGLDVLITVHEPVVDPEVAAIIERLPADLAGMRLGISPEAVACTATATPVVVAVTVAIVGTALGNCSQGWNSSEWVINPVIGLRELAPTLAVQRLVAMREQQLAAPMR
jgi:hypothetical protein